MTLDEIDAICKAATPGPWQLDRVEEEDDCYRNEDVYHVLGPLDTDAEHCQLRNREGDKQILVSNTPFYPAAVSAENMRFIAMARTALPKLLEVAIWAQIALEQYGYMSDYHDPMHQLAAALREFEEKKDGA
jgi:hypothetical protein